MEINNNYENCLKIINVLNINMNDLYNYYKMNNKNENEGMIEEIVEEIVDNMIKKEINEEKINENIKEIEKKEEKIEIKKSLFQKTETKRWGDYDSDDEYENNYTKNSKNLETEFKTFKDIIKQNNNDIIEKSEQNKVKIIEKSEQSTKNDNEFIKKEKKNNKNDNNKTIIYDLQEFLDFMKSSPHKEYIIDEKAHCEHTYNGTLCNNVRKCKKIHIQRCIKGSNCTNKKCPYIHLKDMPNNEAHINFIETMELYNDIKSKKRVQL